MEIVDPEGHVIGWGSTSEPNDGCTDGFVINEGPWPEVVCMTDSTPVTVTDEMVQAGAEAEHRHRHDGVEVRVRAIIAAALGAR